MLLLKYFTNFFVLLSISCIFSTYSALHTLQNVQKPYKKYTILVIILIICIIIAIAIFTSYKTANSQTFVDCNPIISRSIIETKHSRSAAPSRPPMSGRRSIPPSPRRPFSAFSAKPTKQQLETQIKSLIAVILGDIISLRDLQKKKQHTLPKYIEYSAAQSMKPDYKDLEPKISAKYTDAQNAVIALSSEAILDLESTLHDITGEKIAKRNAILENYDFHVVLARTQLLSELTDLCKVSSKPAFAILSAFIDPLSGSRGNTLQTETDISAKKAYDAVLNARESQLSIYLAYVKLEQKFVNNLHKLTQKQLTFASWM